MKKWWMLAGAAAAVAIGAAYFYFYGPAVPIARVARSDVVQSVVASGRVETPYRTDIGVQVVGTVVSVPVEQGQTVRRGQVLVELDATEARANQAQSEATLANARAQLERNRRLAAKGFVNRSALDDAEHAFAVARAQLDAAKAKLAYARVVAPRNGVLIARNVEVGDVVQPGKALMVLAPEGETHIVLQIDERNVGRLALGQEALASAEAFPRERFAARLVYINPGIDAQRGTVEVKLLVPQPPAYLKQDMTVSADIEVARSPATLALPSAAVRDSGGSPWVLRVERGRAERRAVTLGLQGNGVAEIRSGLAEGDEVVATDLALAPGRRVRPLQPAPRG